MSLFRLLVFHNYDLATKTWLHNLKYTLEASCGVRRQYVMVLELRKRISLAPVLSRLVTIELSQLSGGGAHL